MICASCTFKFNLKIATEGIAAMLTPQTKLPNYYNAWRYHVEIMMSYTGIYAWLDFCLFLMYVSWDGAMLFNLLGQMIINVFPFVVVKSIFHCVILSAIEYCATFKYILICVIVVLCCLIMCLIIRAICDLY